MSISPEGPWGLRCRCGLEIEAVDQDTLVVAVNGHLDDQHPSVAGSYDADDILSLAYRKPARAGS